MREIIAPLALPYPPTRRGLFRRAIAYLATDAGYPEVPKTMAARGDLVLVQLKTDASPVALGICMGSMALVAGPNGLVMEPPEAWLMAWRI